MKSIVLQPATIEQIALFKLGAASVYKRAGLPPQEADWRFNLQLAKIAKDLTMAQTLDAGEAATEVTPESNPVTEAPKAVPKTDGAPVETEGEKAKSAKINKIAAALLGVFGKPAKV